MSSNWYDLEQYRRQELDYCLKLAKGHTQQTSDFYARYGLALAYHQMYLDAVNLAAECKDTPQFEGVIDLISSMANGTLPSAELEFPDNLQHIANDALYHYLRRKAIKMHASFKRLSTEHAQTIVGDLNVLEGLYKVSGEYLEALPQSDLSHVPNTAREIDILSGANAELQEITQEKNSSMGRVRRRYDQMEVE